MANIHSIRFSMTINQLHEIDKELIDLHQSMRKVPSACHQIYKDHIKYFMEEKKALIEELKFILKDLDYDKVIESKKLG